MMTAQIFVKNLALSLLFAILLFASPPTFATSFTTFRFGTEIPGLTVPSNFDVYLALHTTKDGSESYNPSVGNIPSTWKARPGDFFSDDVIFSSPNSGTPQQVLWGHMDDGFGGIAPTPNFFGPLRMDFPSPIELVVWRTFGLQPGQSAKFFDPRGVLIGEVTETGSSLIGALSSVPIGSIIVEGVIATQPGHYTQPSEIRQLRFNFAPNPIPEPATILLFGYGLIGLLGILRKGKTQ